MAFSKSVDDLRKYWKTTGGTLISYSATGRTFSTRTDLFEAACESAFAPSVRRALDYKGLSTKDRDRIRKQASKELARSLDRLFKINRITDSSYDEWAKDTADEILKTYHCNSVDDYTYVTLKNGLISHLNIYYLVAAK